MSIYDQREKSAYGSPLVGTHYAQNKFILKWWTPAHDQLLAQQIKEKQWAWFWSITDKIRDITEPTSIDKWKTEDPVCSQYAWYNVLMYFSASRAEQIGLTSAIRKPLWKICPLCNENFVEDSLPIPLVERLGIDYLDYCAPCLKDIILPDTGSDDVTRQEAIDYLQNLAQLLGRVPTQDFGVNTLDIQGLSSNDRLAVLRLLQRKPTLHRVKCEFNSWLAALIDAGVLEDGTRKTSRGIQTLAKDRHVCLSLGEKTIDDFLFDRGIHHDKEPRYPTGNFRADFLVVGVFIEYFGLAGNPDYDAKIKQKMRICQEFGINLISIYPGDLVSDEKLQRKLSPILNKGS
jgi:hypothetical protein